jgi:replication factor C subunit 3/5
MLLVDKYKVKSKKDVIFHKDIYDKLLNDVPLNTQIEKENELLKEVDGIQKCADYKKQLKMDKIFKFIRMSNLLIHGVHKNTLVQMLLQEIYGDDINDLQIESYKIVGYGNTDVFINIKQSKYHIIIEPNNTGIDKYIIQEVVKEYAKQQILCFEDIIVPYKIVLINNIDNLSYYAQTSLRYTMERYHRTCKFILCASQLSKILDPLRSRCKPIRVPKPNNDELFNYVYTVAHNEKIEIHSSTINNIVANSNRNVVTCLWWLEYYKNNIYNFTFAWKKYLNNITAMLHYVHKQKRVINIASIVLIRQIFNKILITNITGSEIIIELLTQIIENYPEYDKNFIIEITTVFRQYESRLSCGTRIIMHLEALVMNLFNVFYKFPYTST